VAACPDERLVGAHDSEFTVGAAGATNVNEKVREAPLNVAVTVAVAPTVTVAAVAVNVALYDPAGIITDEGTAMDGVLLASVTRAPPDAAGRDRPTEHVAVPPEPRVAGAQDVDTRTGVAPAPPLTAVNSTGAIP
jgi:hypothetical protein